MQTGSECILSCSCFFFFETPAPTTTPERWLEFVPTESWRCLLLNFLNTNYCFQRNCPRFSGTSSTSQWAVLLGAVSLKKYFQSNCPQWRMQCSLSKKDKLTIYPIRISQYYDCHKILFPYKWCKNRWSLMIQLLHSFSTVHTCTSAAAACYCHCILNGCLSCTSPSTENRMWGCCCFIEGLISTGAAWPFKWLPPGLIGE